MATSGPETKGESTHDSSNGTNPDNITSILTDTDTTNTDDLILQANGHKPQLHRQFNWLSALGLGFSITNSWVGYLSNFGQIMTYGGPRLVIVGLILAFLAQSIISIGLAEIGSAFPSSGGQYHFCFLLAPKRSRRFAAYVVGWISVVAWWVVTYVCLPLLELVFLSGKRIVIPVFVASKKISVICQVTLLISIVGVAMTLFVPTGMHEHVQPPSFLVSPSAGETGWGSGVSWMLGICNAMYAFGGTDGALHIAEEMQHPGRRVPQVIIATLLIGLATTLPLFVALLLFSSDAKEIMGSPLPSAELIHQATGSRAGTMFLIIWILIVYISCLPSQWVTSGRLAWAFARDNGTPFPRYFSAISPTFQFPIRTTMAAFVFVLLYGLLYLASTTTFYSIITSAVLFLNITYAVPQGILLLRRARSLLSSTSKMNTNMSILPPRYLNLGPLIGSFCNAFSILWIIVLGIFVCFPPEIPVDLASANYTPAVVVGIFGLIVLFWGLGGKKMFEGPRVEWEGLELGLRMRVRGKA
ncbi:amino acid permease-domain-containing protein [Aspergillus similis]